VLLVGLTGNIASGKSAVAKLFADRGATLIDADVLAREAVAPGTPALDAIVKRWGKAVVTPDGSLNRGALGKIVFADRSERDALNAIVHPPVELLRKALLDAARTRGDNIVVCDIPLLYEKDMSSRFDTVVLVDAPKPVRLERLVKERGMPRRDAEAVMAAQMSPEVKRARADVIIDNDGSRAQLEKRVDVVWRALMRDAEKQETN
jgi:dephospho-CoA kinase